MLVMFKESTYSVWILSRITEALIQMGLVG